MLRLRPHPFRAASCVGWRSPLRPTAWLLIHVQAVVHEGQGFDKTPVSGIGGAVFEDLFGDTAVEDIVEVDDAA